MDHTTTHSRIQLPNHLENMGFSFKQPFWCSGSLSAFPNLLLCTDICELFLAVGIHLMSLVNESINLFQTSALTFFTGHAFAGLLCNAVVRQGTATLWWFYCQPQTLTALPYRYQCRPPSPSGHWIESGYIFLPLVLVNLHVRLNLLTFHFPFFIVKSISFWLYPILKGEQKSWLLFSNLI